MQDRREACNKASAVLAQHSKCACKAGEEAIMHLPADRSFLIFCQIVLSLLLTRRPSCKLRLLLPPGPLYCCGLLSVPNNKQQVISQPLAIHILGAWWEQTITNVLMHHQVPCLL